MYRKPPQRNIAAAVDQAVFAKYVSIAAVAGLPFALVCYLVHTLAQHLPKVLPH